MVIYYGFSYDNENKLVAYAVNERKEVHFGEIGDYGGYEKVPVKGDTYQVKDEIKDTDWTRTKYDWTGQVWAVSVDGLRDVIESVLDVVDEVSVVKDTVRECDDLSEFWEEIKVDKNSEEVLKFVYNVIAPDNAITMEMAEMAVEKGDYDTPEEFADEFGFEIVSKEEYFGWAGDDGGGGDGLVGSGQGGIV